MAAKDNETGAVIVEHHDDVALVRLNRPHSRNALDPESRPASKRPFPP